MKKVLVIGGSSFIGLHILDQSKGKYDLWATYHRNKIEVSGCSVLQLDITANEKAKFLIQSVKPDVVVLCSAISSTIARNTPEKDIDSVNINGVKNVVEACRELNNKLIFISTDCVFSGENGPYKEDSLPGPIQQYGRTKVEGERIVSTLSNHAIVRTSLVYGWPKQFQHENFVTNLIKKTKSGEEFFAHNDMFRTPTYVQDIQEATVKIIDNNLRGVFHVGGQYINMYDFAKEICNVFNLPTIKLFPSEASEEYGCRPKRAGLYCSNSQEQLNIKFKTVSEGLKMMKEEMNGESEKENAKQKTALVTGGAGFIGSHLVEALVEKGLKVRVVDSLVKGKLASIKHLIDEEKVEFIEGDIKNKDIIDHCMEGIDYVFHTAGIHIKRSSDSPDDCIQSNIKGSYNVFHSALKHQVKRVIFSSSSSIYGDPKKLPMNENDQPYPAEPYGASKLFCEHLLDHLAKKGLKYNALRYYNVYGERQAAHAYYTTVVTHFIKRIMNNEPPTIDGKGDQSMDFTHVSDVVRANIAAMDSEAVNEVFNVGTGVSTSVAQLAEIIIRALGKEIKPIFREREVLVTRRQADITKAENLLGFKAQISVEEGLAQVAQEIAAHPEKY